MNWLFTRLLHSPRDDFLATIPEGAIRVYFDINPILPPARDDPRAKQAIERADVVMWADDDEAGGSILRARFQNRLAHRPPETIPMREEYETWLALTAGRTIELWRNDRPR